MTSASPPVLDHGAHSAPTNTTFIALSPAGVAILMGVMGCSGSGSFSFTSGSLGCTGTASGSGSGLFCSYACLPAARAAANAAEGALRFRNFGGPVFGGMDMVGVAASFPFRVRKVAGWYMGVLPRLGGAVADVEGYDGDGEGDWGGEEGR